MKVGSAAINAPSPGKNLVYDSKRLIGRQFNDDCVIRDRAGWSFDVVRENVSDEKVHYDFPIANISEILGKSNDQNNGKKTG